MHRLPLLCLLAVLMAGPTDGQAQSDLTVIHAGTVLTVPGEKPLERQSILVTGGRITAIENGFVTPDGATIIDLSNSFVLPGLIDTHIHLQFGGENYANDLVTLEYGVVT